MKNLMKPVRLLILSDLHLEFRRDQPPDFNIASSRPDIVILAGDIDTDAVRVVAWAEKIFAGLPVLYVHGNHEGYGRKLDHVIEKLTAASLKSPTVHYLNRGEYRYRGIRFLGATLWTDFALFGVERRHDCMVAASEAISDYHFIRLAAERYRKLTPRDTFAYHRTDRAWLESKLDESFPGPTVVVTHMAPSRKSVAERYADDLLSAAFVSNLDEVVAKADIWVHGHTHDPYDYAIGKCRVVCNPLGYVDREGAAENERFDSGFIIEVPGTLSHGPIDIGDQ